MARIGGTRPPGSGGVRPPDGDNPDGSPITFPLEADTWRRLPEVYRAADVSNGYALLLYLSAGLSELNEVTELIDALRFVPYGERGGSGPHDVAPPWDEVSDEDPLNDSTLVNGVTAEPEWLPWLAQLLGVDRRYINEADLRIVLEQPRELVWNHGTREAIIRQARRTLGEAASVTVTANPASVAEPADRPFTIEVTVDPDDTSLLITWGQLRAAAPTWRQLEALGSFGSTGVGAVYAAIESERPAGFKFTVALA